MQQERTIEGAKDCLINNKWIAKKRGQKQIED